MRVLTMLAVVPVVVLAACGSEPTPLELTSVGVTIDGTRGNPPPYFVSALCSPDGEHTVNITGASAVQNTGGRARFRFVVNWPGGVDAVTPGGYAELLPSAFVPAQGSTGTVNACDSGSDEQAEIGIVFPEIGDDDVGVKRIRVTYEADGQAGTTTGEVAFVQCGINRVADDDLCRDRTGG